MVDPPRWPAHGRLWSHLASDTSLAELHALAAAAGLPARGFEGDHYDVPQERYDDVVAAGAVPVSGRELLRRLVAGGLRVPKRRGERVLASFADGEWLGATGPHRLDVVLSPLEPPAPTTVGGWALVVAPEGLLLASVPDGGWELPGGRTAAGERAVEVAARDVSGRGLPLDAESLVPCGYLRLRLLGGAPDGWSLPAPWAHQALFSAAVGAAWGGAPPDWCPLAEAVERVGQRPWWPLAERVLAGAAALR
jgi:hypothetical protein